MKLIDSDFINSLTNLQLVTNLSEDVLLLSTSMLSFMHGNVTDLKKLKKAVHEIAGSYS